MRHSTHAGTATVAWLALGPVLHPIDTWMDLGIFGTGLLVAQFASRLPDIDHHNSKITHDTPGGALISRIVRTTLGGHRMGAHSIFAVLFVYLVTNALALVVIAAFHSAGELSDIPISTAFVIAGAAAIGCAAHIFGDMLTAQGVGVLYPMTRRRVRLLTLKTSKPKPAPMLFGEAMVNVVQCLAGVYFLAALLAV